MYSIYLYLILFSISTRLCLVAESVENVDYIDLDDKLNLDESNELMVNVTDVADNEISESSTALNLVESTTKQTADETVVVDSKVHELSAVLKSTIHRIRQQFKKMDIVFLIDSSSSVGKSNFRSELKFVVKFLSDFNVSFNYTRVSIVTFSSQEKIVCNTSVC